MLLLGFTTYHVASSYEDAPQQCFGLNANVTVIAATIEYYHWRSVHHLFFD